MSYTARELVTAVDSKNYRAEINSNFNILNQATQDIQADLDTLSMNSVLGLSNLPWIAFALQPDGVIGYDKLPLTFTYPNTVTITPTIAPVMIGWKFHIITAAQLIVANIETLNPTEGTKRIAVGLASNGAPNASWVIVASENTTTDAAAGIQLLVYEFESVRSGSGFYTTKNLRRGCPVLMDGASHDRAIRPYNQIYLNSTGVLRTTVGTLPSGALIQEPCEIHGLYARIGVSPPVGKTVTLQIRKYGSTDNIVIGDIWWTSNDPHGVVKYAGPNAPPTKLEAGDFIQPYLTSVSSTGLAADLSISIRSRPLIVT